MNSAKNILESNAGEVSKRMMNAFHTSKQVANTVNAVNNGDTMNKLNSIISLASLAMG